MTPVTDFWKSLVRYPTRLGWAILSLLLILCFLVGLHACGRLASHKGEPMPYSKMSTRAVR